MGVENFAVEQAHVEHGAAVTAEDLLRAVESSGYQASVIDHHHHGGHEDHMSHDVPEEQLRPRLIGSAVLASTGAGAVDGDAVAVPRLAVGGAGAHHADRLSGGGYLFHKAALEQRPPRQFDDGHPWCRLGTLGLHLWSLVVLVTGVSHGMVTARANAHFEVAAAVTVFLLAGACGRRPSARRVPPRALPSLAPGTPPCCATAPRSASPAGELAVGDVIVVKPGERVATDGVVVEGFGAGHPAMTGESLPVDVRPGDEVLGGAVTTYGRILLRAKKVGSDTSWPGWPGWWLTPRAASVFDPAVADRVSAVFVPVVLVIAALTLAGYC